MLNHAFSYALSVLVAEKRDEKGATAVEYALVVGLVSLVVVVAVATFGPKITTFVTGVSFGGSSPTTSN